METINGGYVTSELPPSESFTMSFGDNYIVATPFKRKTEAKPLMEEIFKIFFNKITTQINIYML